MKKNCWEVKNCGREEGGKKTDSLGICPAASESRLDGIHSGRNGGRACWVIAGTLCRGKMQGTFAAKFDSCEKCDFYQSVQKDEFPEFVYSSVLLRKLR